MASRTTVRPTLFGLALLLVLMASFALRPPTADPSVTGFVWAGLAGALVFGAAWPVLAVRQVRVRVVAAPTDLVVGQQGTLELELTGRASGLSIGATGSATAVLDVVSPGAVRIPLTVSHRGVYRRIRLDVGSDAPFGVLWASRSRLVELPRELLVGPVPAPSAVEAEALPGELSEQRPSGHANRGEAVRSVRPYVTGDPSHLVHWPSTARFGQLVVRELEPPATRGLAVVVDLRCADEPGAEHRSETAASRAAGIAESVLDHGGRVLMVTAEAGGAVVDEVGDALGVRRRLARAIPGAPAAVPDGWPTHLVTPHDGSVLQSSPSGATFAARNGGAGPS